MDYDQLWGRQFFPHFGLSIDAWAMVSDRVREKHIDYGQRTHFIHLYILNVSIAEKEFGLSE
jgi:hypothetical protein